MYKISLLTLFAMTMAMFTVAAASLPPPPRIAGSPVLVAEVSPH